MRHHPPQRTTRRPAHALCVAKGGAGGREEAAHARGPAARSPATAASLTRAVLSLALTPAPLSRTNACARLLRQGDRTLSLIAHEATRRSRLLLQAGADKDAKNGAWSLSSLRRTTATRCRAAAARAGADKEAKDITATRLSSMRDNGHSRSCGCCSRPARQGGA